MSGKGERESGILRGRMRVRESGIERVRLRVRV